MMLKRGMLRAAMIVIAGAMLAGCAKTAQISGDPSKTSLAATPLSAPQKTLVDTGVRQIIKDTGAARIVSMDAANAKLPDQTNVCGYVSYKTSDGNPAEQRYFVRLGPENGTEAALMGQVANNPANAAKVKFMCMQAGLK